MASLSGAPFSLRQQLILFIVVRLSSLVVVFVPGEKHTTRQVGLCALFGLGVLGFWEVSGLFNVGEFLGAVLAA